MATHSKSSINSLPLSGPSCSKCGLPMLLLEIQSDKRRFEIHLFECPQCEAQEAHIVRKPMTGDGFAEAG
jgi:Zn finger protein HypA/HybF involved in hydrogenase expression